MQGIYNYIPETNHMSRLYSVAAVIYLQFVLHVMLFRPLNMLRIIIIIPSCFNLTIPTPFTQFVT